MVDVRDDDLAPVLLDLERRMSRTDIAAALGIEERDVDEIASGYLPNRDVADRLRRLAADPSGARQAVKTTARISGLVIAAFIVTDLVFFGLVAAFVLLR